jgi:hypothetical protein
VDETRECLLGKLRKGDVLDGEECAVFISRIKDHVPGCVKKILGLLPSEWAKLAIEYDENPLGTRRS